MRNIPLFLLFIVFSCNQPSTNQQLESNALPELLEKKDSISITKPQDSTVIYSYENETSTLGIGLVMGIDTMELYNDSLLQNLYVKWDMYQEQPNPTLYSKFWKPDYGIMHFICLEKNSKYFKVLINYNDIKFFPNTRKYKFENWEEYISSSYGIGSNPRDSVMYSEPDKKSSIIKIKGNGLCALQIRGDWVKVADCNGALDEPCSEILNQKPNKTATKGWLKWKEKNKLLIAICLMP
jgi:hypothetical protein